MSNNHKKKLDTDIAFWKRLSIAFIRAFLKTFGPITLVKTVYKELQDNNDQLSKIKISETIQENVFDQIHNLDNISNYSSLTTEQITKLRIALFSALQNDREALTDHVMNWLKSDPDNPDANFCASIVLDQGPSHSIEDLNEKLKSSIIFLTKTIQACPSYAPAYLRRAKQYLSAPRNLTMEDCDLALADLNKAIEINEDYIDPIYTRGILYFVLKRYNDCEQDLLKFISIVPDHARAYIALAKCYDSQGKRNPAYAMTLKADLLDGKWPIHFKSFALRTLIISTLAFFSLLAMLLILLFFVPPMKFFVIPVIIIEVMLSYIIYSFIKVLERSNDISGMNTWCFHAFPKGEYDIKVRIPSLVESWLKERLEMAIEKYQST